jgi:hypothetical protein
MDSFVNRDFGCPCSSHIVLPPLSLPLLSPVVVVVFVVVVFIVVVFVAVAVVVVFVAGMVAVARTSATLCRWPRHSVRSLDRTCAGLDTDLVPVAGFGSAGMVAVAGWYFCRLHSRVVSPVDFCYYLFLIFYIYLGRRC